MTWENMIKVRANHDPFEVSPKGNVEVDQVRKKKLDQPFVPFP